MKSYVFARARHCDAHFLQAIYDVGQTSELSYSFLSLDQPGICYPLHFQCHEVSMRVPLV